MAGLLDWMGASPPDPQQMGLLGAAQAMSSAYAPQPASRLPLAKPNMAYLLGQAAGGYGSGYGAGLQQQQQQAQNYGAQLGNLQNAALYNLRAPYMGAPQVGLPGMPTGAQGASPGASAPMGAPMPGGGSMVASGGGVAPGGASIGAPGLQSDVMRQMMVRQALGIPLTQAQNALIAAGRNPFDLSDPSVKNTLEAESTNIAGIKPVVPGERAGIPDKNYNPATGQYDVAPGAYDTMAKGAFTQAQAAGAGGLGAKESQAAFEAGLDVNKNNQIERQKAFYSTGIMPPDSSGSGAMPTAISPAGDMATSKGTVVPAPPLPSAQFQGTDALLKQNQNTAETEKSFGAIRPTLEGTEARMVGLAKAMQTVQGGGLNEGRAEIANNLRGLGMTSLADTVMSAKDTGAVQTAMGLQTLDVLGQLKQINQGTGGRILNSEFTNLVDKQYGPNLQPQAVYDLLTQALGGVYQTRNMIDDYYKVGKPAGWRDANAFQSAYYGNPANSMSNMIDYAGKSIGPLKGMKGPAPAFPEGATKTIGGKTYTFQGGQWQQ